LPDERSRRRREKDQAEPGAGGTDILRDLVAVGASVCIGDTSSHRFTEDSA